MSEAELSANVVNLGCRLNASESELIRQNLAALNIDDCIVVNSCAVTAEAVRQTRQTIRKLYRQNPDKRVIVTGCAAQIDPSSFAAMPEVKLVIGNQEKLHAKHYHPDQQPQEKINARQFSKELDSFSLTEEATTPLSLTSFGERTRAFVQVQNGCDHSCTFCIIPQGRGPSRSLASGTIVNQIRQLVAHDIQEVVLCGVDMTAWGRDLPYQTSLGHLVQSILRLVPELPRLRLSSVDCSELDDRLIGLFADEPRLMPHLHLSLQSGDDLILKRMKRRHNSQHAVDLTNRLRRVRPDIVFGADMITGFPTETESMFQNSLAHIEACQICWLHVFPYSARQGTPAARIPNQVDKPIRKARADSLRRAAANQALAYLHTQVGQQLTVLVESKGQGYSPAYAPVVVDNLKEDFSGLVEVRVTGVTPESKLTAQRLGEAMPI